MLSHFTWLEFCQFLGVAAVIYYFMVAMVYYQVELKTLFRRKKTIEGSSAEPLQTSHNAVIGGYTTRFSGQDIKSIYSPEVPAPAAIVATENGPIDPLSLPEPELNNEEALSAVLMADIEAGLEDEDLKYGDPVLIAEFDLEEELSMDSEEFLKLVQEGIEALEPRQREAVFAMANTVETTNEDLVKENLLQSADELADTRFEKIDDTTEEVIGQEPFDNAEEVLMEESPAPLMITHARE
jgi:hypothetical protein